MKQSKVETKQPAIKSGDSKALTIAAFEAQGVYSAAAKNLTAAIKAEFFTGKRLDIKSTADAVTVYVLWLKEYSNQFLTDHAPVFQSGKKAGEPIKNIRDLYVYNSAVRTMRKISEERGYKMKTGGDSVTFEKIEEPEAEPETKEPESRGELPEQTEADNAPRNDTELADMVIQKLNSLCDTVREQGAHIGMDDHAINALLADTIQGYTVSLHLAAGRTLDAQGQVVVDNKKAA